MIIFNLKNRILLNLLVFLMLSFAYYSPLYAYLKVSPDTQRIKINPGKRFKTFIDISNNSNNPVLIDVQPEIWDENYCPTGEEPYWILIKPKRFTIKPGTTKRVKCIAKIPKNINRSYLTQIFFASTNNKTQSNLNISTRISSLVYWYIQKQDNSIKDNTNE